jgi:hypothetical protein
MSIPMLTGRERAVLAAVIDSFVRTAAPAGSQKIRMDCEFGVSAATIQNTMADLEAKGLLTHPHTSAGRLPTDLAYRYYVDGLMRRGRLTLRERVQIEQEFIGLEVAGVCRSNRSNEDAIPESCFHRRLDVESHDPTHSMRKLSSTSAGGSCRRRVSEGVHE